MTWVLLWKIVLVLALAAFGVMAGLVTVLGAGDVRKMLRELRAMRRSEDLPED